jgi:hypothetical protein
VKPKFIVIIMILSAMLFTSCAWLFNGIVFPHQCKKCQVVDKVTNEVVWSDEGCGAAVTNLEDNAKVQAYNLNSTGTYERYEVVCDTYTEPK